MKAEALLWGCAKGSPWAEGLRCQEKEPPELPWTGEELVKRGVSGLVFSPPCGVMTTHENYPGLAGGTTSHYFWADPKVDGLARYPHVMQDGSEAQILNRLQAFESRLDVAGWFGADDAQRGKLDPPMTPEERQVALAAGYATIHNNDPRHRPVVLDFAPPWRTPMDYAQAILICDVPGVHHYPIGKGRYPGKSSPGGQPLSYDVHKIVRDMRDFWANSPLWFLLQLCSWWDMPKPGELRGSTQQPTAEQIEEMARYAVAGGATHIVGFGGSKRPPDSEQWQGWWRAVEWMTQ